MSSPLEDILLLLKQVEGKVDTLLSTLCDCDQCKASDCDHPFVSACLGAGGGHGNHFHPHSD